MYGFQDEVWWSRLATPNLRAWTPDQPLRLVEQTVAKDDPDPIAIACYGLLTPPCDQGHAEEMWLRFVEGRPVSAVTTSYLAWCAERAAARGMRFLVMVWDNAPWHVSREVRTWLKRHNHHVVVRGQGCRIIPSYLPVKSPWLNSIEPKWLHAKRRIVEPDGLLSAAELRRRVVEAFACTHEPDLVQPKKAQSNKPVVQPRRTCTCGAKKVQPTPLPKKPACSKKAA